MASVEDRQEAYNRLAKAWPEKAAPAFRSLALLPALRSQPLRRHIWEAACSLTADGDARDLQAVLSKGVIALISEGIRHERAAALFRNGL